MSLQVFQLVEREGEGIRGTARHEALVGRAIADHGVTVRLHIGMAMHGPADGSETKRPQQTVAPLAGSLELAVRAEHAKGDEGAVMADVLREDGTVLVAWEHSRIPDLVAALPDPPAGVPGEWPKARYDLVWAFAREGEVWRFDVIEQDVLS